MSVWRRKALELLPDLRSEIQAPDATIYSVFMDLVPRCQSAHDRGDKAELERINAFAEWCASQKAFDRWNAAGVSFYEHLADSNRTLSEIPRWVKRKIFEDVAGLLELRAGAERVEELRNQYK